MFTRKTAGVFVCVFVAKVILAINTAAIQSICSCF